MHVFLYFGYVAIVAIAAIYMGSFIGTMFSTVNPFSVVIASDAAGISFDQGLTLRIIGLVLASAITLIYIYRYAKKVKENPENSIIYDDLDSIENQFLPDYVHDNVISLDWIRIMIRFVF